MMKNKSYIGIAFIILVFGIIFIPRIIDRVKGDSVVEEDRRSKNITTSSKDSGLHRFATAPTFSFLNENEEVISNQFYKNKVHIVEFFFSTCPTICPIMNRNMKKIDSVYGSRKDFGIVSITINPVYDTSIVLKEYKEQYNITNQNWNFLTGDEDVIYKLAKEFNIYAGVNPKAAGGFEHSGLFALIDKEGNIRSRKDSYGNPIMYYDGTDINSINELKQDIQKLLEE